MIIVGYQGIGKSSICKYNDKYIDLESSWTKVNGERNFDWASVYANIAVGLSEQGYTVFVSSHKIVREELRKHSEPVIIIYPSIELKDKWIDKLRHRYERTKLNKDLAAWKNAEECYEENINDLMADMSWATVIKLNNDDYDLHNIMNIIPKLYKDYGDYDISIKGDINE